MITLEKKLQIDLSQYRHVFANIKEAILLIDDNGTIHYGNAKAFSLLDINNVEQKSIDDYLDFDLLKDQQQEMHLLMQHKKITEKLLKVHAFKINPHVFCLILTKMSLNNNKIKQFLNDHTVGGPAGVVMYKNNKIIDYDFAFARMFQYDMEELIGNNVEKLISSRRRKGDSSAVDKEFTGITKDGEGFPLELKEHAFDIDGTIVHVAILQDKSESIASRNQIKYMAFYDELTDLPNWNFFNNALQEAIETAEGNDECLAVFFIDLDYFKEINDTFGYIFGDKLLKACGERLKTFLQLDTFLARMSGDEFLILQRNTDKQHAIQLAKRLITEFERPFTIEDFEIHTTISIGISLYPENGQSSNDLIKHADSAMYVIKEKHRNSYKLFETSISEDFKRRLTLENELRKALKNKQFELHYQPQKNLHTGEVVGLEALLRWNHPRKGYISPNEFIPLAEKTGLIIDIGDWVLQEACRQNKEWQDRGYRPLVVSVNLSAKQFYQHCLVEKVKKTLAEVELEPKYLELEITESMAMTKEAYILEMLHELRGLGVYVSIDDFGTGYSSLKYLSIFPISKLKIDKIFIDNPLKQNQAIVKSIIHMSHSLNMRVIAEGVETYEQLAFLKNVKCDEMQGYYFSRPLPPEQLLAFLTKTS